MLRLGLLVKGSRDILTKSIREKDDKLETLRKRIIEHLETLEQTEEKQIKKSLVDQGLAKAGVPVGTRHTWKNGIVHIKMPSGKWKRVYETHDRGAKMAISALKRKIAAAQDAQTMMQIILENRDRFSDAQGNPLPFVQDMSKYVAEAQEKFKDMPQISSKKKKEVPGKTKSDAIDEFIRGNKGPGNTIERNGDTVIISKKEGEFVLSSVDRIKKEYPKIGWTVQGGKIIGKMGKGEKQPKKEPAEQKKMPKKKEQRDTGVNDSRKEAPIEESEQEKTDFEKIQNKYKQAKAIEGDEDEIHAGKEIIRGTWKLVEADTPTASHDENTFHKTKGFPGDTEDSTINDRDYEHDREAQEVVIEMAGDYDHQALSLEKPVVVTKDGIVISGNNRTMSSKIAARKGTDKKYIETLKRRAKKFGFTAKQVAQFKHPRVVFETNETGDYNTELFAKFNDRQEKSMGPISTAVKISKMMKPKTVESIADKIGAFETLGELYANKKACNEIYGILKDAGHVTMQSLPEYMESGYITENGKSFLENVMLGSVITEKNIRGLNREGCKSIRQKLMRAITPLVENKSMNGYSVTKELNEAIDIAMQVSIQKDRFKDVTEYSQQLGMFGNDDPIAIEFAKRLETTQKEFAAFMQSINGGLRYAANGEADVFLGGTESRESILSRLLQVKKALAEILNGISIL
jgi:hypothetical protein